MLKPMALPHWSRRDLIVLFVWVCLFWVVVLTLLLVLVKWLT